MSAPQYPSVGVVIPTHNRPALMRRALESVMKQGYEGRIHAVVVFDRCTLDQDLYQDDPARRVSVLANDRTPGLAGSRNTGILSLESDLVAFCDDDDTWLDHKLVRQVDFIRGHSADFVTTAMRVDYQDRSVVRLAGRTEVTLADLARSRMAMLHSSSFLFRRDAMLGKQGFGLVDETIPRSMAEDWDLLLRAARQRPIGHIDEPLVRVLWGQSSYFNDAWVDKNAACKWLIDHHPEIRADRKALGLQLGKLAFGYAALGDHGRALHSARQAIVANWQEPRVPIALLVLAGVSPKWIVTQLNRRGHGI